MTLHCQKTGNHWPCHNAAHGDQMATTLGLKNYTITLAGDVPPTMRETIAAALARPRHRITAGIE